MAALKLKKYPKKPKASASVETMQNYLKKRSEIDKENKKRKAETAKKATLRKKIQGL
ncbi:MAG: hypothetical protein Q7U47_01335 [Paludibacter sp.]|nr:hypothetical protein [Paludibacter sp.]